jgi:CRP-like cAMP-binding protein
LSQHPLQNFVVRFKQGDTVFEEGDKGRTMYIVQTGLVSLYHQVNDHRQKLGTLEKGDFFGEMSILEGLPRTVSALAEEDAELIEINHTVFDKMIRGNIEIAVRMLRKLSIRLRESESRIAALQASGAKAARPARAARAQGTSAKISTDDGRARLEVEDRDVSYPLKASSTLIGRYDPVTQLMPDIDLTDLDLKRSVSRQHARLLKDDTGYALIEEVGALNGTLVNGVQLTPGQSHPVHDGDRLSFGSVCVVFRA